MKPIFYQYLLLLVLLLFGLRTDRPTVYTATPFTQPPGGNQNTLASLFWMCAAHSVENHNIASMASLTLLLLMQVIVLFIVHRKDFC